MPRSDDVSPAFERSRRGYRRMVAGLVVSGIVVLAAWAFVAVHFIVKFW